VRFEERSDIRIVDLILRFKASKNLNCRNFRPLQRYRTEPVSMQIALVDAAQGHLQRELDRVSPESLS
jgi:hypothetical protein